MASSPKSQHQWLRQMDICSKKIGTQKPCSLVHCAAWPCYLPLTHANDNMGNDMQQRPSCCQVQQLVLEPRVGIPDLESKMHTAGQPSVLICSQDRVLLSPRPGRASVERH
mmetsp:Transcript_19217/g.33991  ORF Transcript_19217/g.33991 Transcript_19217/m.33991 type:complete len:111 (-) Transcript_19217:1758-2090(-)